jgi:hypothetical protein
VHAESTLGDQSPPERALFSFRGIGIMGSSVLKPIPLPMRDQWPVSMVFNVLEW